MAKEAADAERRKEERRRKERKNRDSFTALVRQALADGRISAKTRFKVCHLFHKPPEGSRRRLDRSSASGAGRRPHLCRDTLQGAVVHRTKPCTKWHICKVRVSAIQFFCRARERGRADVHTDF